MSPFSNVRMSPLAELPGADFHGWGTVGDERVGARAFARDAGAFEGAGVAAGGGGPAGLERSAGQALVASVAGEGRCGADLAPARSAFASKDGRSQAGADRGAFARQVSRFRSDAGG